MSQPAPSIVMAYCYVNKCAKVHSALMGSRFRWAAKPWAAAMRLDMLPINESQLEANTDAALRRKHP